MCASARPPPTKRAAVARAAVAPAKKAQVAAPPSLPKKAVAPVPAFRPNGPTVPAVCPMDMVLEIVGTAKADHGRRYEEHSCCRKALEEDVIICLCWEQILVPNRLRSGHREEMAYTVNWVTDGQDCCRLSLLPRFYVVHGGLFDGVLCQVVSVGQEFDDNVAERAKWKHSCGYARAQVISPLNEAG
jgi:hypothetical protein